MPAGYPTQIGALRERLIVQQNRIAAVVVTSVTRSGAVATAATATPHGFASGDYATVAGATPSGYNGKAAVTVIDPSTFTYPVSNALATPATGTMTVTYATDAQGGRKQSWSTLDTIWAEEIPLRAFERLQFAAVQAQGFSQFRVYRRPDVTVTMRVLWTPRWPLNAAQQTLEINGITFDPDDRRFMMLECSLASIAS